MRIKNVKRWGTVFGVLCAILLYLVVGAVSWIITCGIIKLITLCLGWTFAWSWATGIWLIMFLLQSMFKNTGGRK